MDQQRIWAPWRIGYIAGDEQTANSPESAADEPTTWQEGAEYRCFLCRATANYSDESAAQHRNLVVWRGTHVTALLNRFPYTNGHLLATPHRHVANLYELTNDEHLEAMHALGRFCNVLSELFQSEGFNIGLNLGRAAGAGVPGHLHWHLVPRWKGDHNFMPTLAGIRVIPQSLDAVWEAITESLDGE